MVKSAEPPEGTTGADHWVAAAYLTGIKPRKTAGSDATVGSPTIDQIIARKIGQETPLPSLQLAVEDPNSSSSNCGEGYSCWYTNSISWIDVPTPANEPVQRTSPIPMELNPAVVFERLFGSGATAEERMARMRQNRSILDSVLGELSGLRKDLGADDRRTVGRYTDEIREIERRIQIAAGAHRQSARDGSACGRPRAVRRSHQLQFDLTALAFQGGHDASRDAAWRTGSDRPQLSVPEERSLSERRRRASASTAARTTRTTPTQIRKYADLNRYHVSTLAYFAQRLQSIPDGDGTLLDHSLVLYGTNMGNSNQHQHYDVPHILVGGANGQLKGNRHLPYERKTVTTGNLLLSVMDLYGIHKDQQGDSTGPLSGVV